MKSRFPLKPKLATPSAQCGRKAQNSSRPTSHAPSIHAKRQKTTYLPCASSLLLSPSSRTHPNPSAVFKNLSHANATPTRIDESGAIVAKADRLIARRAIVTRPQYKTTYTCKVYCYIITSENYNDHKPFIDHTTSEKEGDIRLELR